MSGRATAEVVGDLLREGSALRWLGASVLADLHSEAAHRLAELDAEVARLRDDIGPGITGAELRERYASTPTIGQLVEYWNAGHEAAG